MATSPRSISRRSLAALLCLTFTLPLAASGQDKTAPTPASTGASSTALQTTDRLIVRYRDPGLQRQALAPAAQSLSQRAGITVSHLHTSGTGAQVLQLPKKMALKEVEAIARRLAADPAVSYAAPDRLLQHQFAPNDARYPEQWHYYEPIGGINLPEALDISLGAGVVVAVIDTGVRPHADLAANLLPGYDMISDVSNAGDGNGRDPDPSDPGDWQAVDQCGPGSPAEEQPSSWHGTHVAGTVAAVTDNGGGVAAVAPAARLLPVRVLGKCGGYTSDILDAVIWAAGGSIDGVPANPNPAQVVNLSLGGMSSCDDNSQQAFNQARQLGALVVAAAGNNGGGAEEFFPANCAAVVAVAATNRVGSSAFYSNRGANVALAAPGGDLSQAAADGVLSTLDSGTRQPAGDSFGFYHGTSMAAPHVSGVAALLKAAEPALTPAEIAERLIATARPFPGFCSLCGAGIVDAHAALTGQVTPPPEVVALENGVPQTGLGGGPGTVYRYTLEVPAGAGNLRFALSGEQGDADLYVRYGSAPTQDQFDCRPYTGGSNETCEWETAQPGTWHVLVHAFGEFAGAALVGSYEMAESGYTRSPLSGGFFSWDRHAVEVPAGAQRLLVNLSGGRGNADLYLRHGSNPSLLRFDCASRGRGNDASCSVESPQAGEWRIGLFSLPGYRDVTLQVRVIH